MGISVLHRGKIGTGQNSTSINPKENQEVGVKMAEE